VLAQARLVHDAARALAAVDVASSTAVLARERRYVRPTVDDRWARRPALHPAAV
jgi:DNA mismatch repair ATPase MutS